MMLPVSSSAAEETINIERPTDAAYLQMRARAFAAAAGFGIRDQWSIAIAASEAATNIVKFGLPGAVTFRMVDGPPRRLELEANDRGPGFVDVEKALRDGVSEGREPTEIEITPSRRGLGFGLGAISRLMDGLVIRPRPGGGTIVLSHKLVPAPQAARRIAMRTRLIAPGRNSSIDCVTWQTHRLAGALR